MRFRPRMVLCAPPYGPRRIIRIALYVYPQFPGDRSGLHNRLPRYPVVVGFIHAATCQLRRGMSDWQFRHSCHERKALEMNWNIIQGNWGQIKSKAKAQWGRLAGYRGKLIAGNGDTVAEQNQEPDGVAQDGAEAQIKRSQERKKN